MATRPRVIYADIGAEDNPDEYQFRVVGENLEYRRDDDDGWRVWHSLTRERKAIAQFSGLLNNPTEEV